jgi:spore maturation protein CgeB
VRVMVVRPGVSWSVADVGAGWVEGLREAGADVVDFDWAKRLALISDVTELPLKDVGLLAADSLLATVYVARPDVVLVISGWDIPPSVYQTWRRLGQKVILVHTEAPYEDDRHLTMIWCADVHLLNDPVSVARMRDAGADAYYAHHCYRPIVHHPGAGRRDLDFVFVGSGFAGRREFLARVDFAGRTPLLAGHWVNPGPVEPWVDPDLPSPLPNADAADLYRRARTSINLYRLDHVQRPELAVGWAMAPREVEMAACGLWFARMPRPEGDDLLPMLPTFDDPDECSEQLAWAWKHPDLAEQAADRAREAIADRTFTNLARAALGALAARA